MSVLTPSLRAAIAVPQWSKDELWRKARAVPSLDLRFADNKSLVDATTGANLVTFSRASGGTYVDSQGVIRNATTNLLLRSEEFDNASWGKFSASITANTVAAPNETASADSLIEAGASAEHSVSQLFTAVSGNAYTLSVFVKSLSGNRAVKLRFTTTAWTGSINTQVDFNLTTGAGTAITGSPTFTSQAFPGGWWRFSMTTTSTANGTPSASVHLVESVGSPISYTGDGTSGIYIWGAQLEQSSTVGEYIPTTSTINSAPRFDHNPSTGESLGLLVEESRTNLLLRSEEFDQSPWIPIDVSISPNAATAPNGTLTADKLIANNGISLTGNNSNGSIFQNLAGTTAIQYVYSFYAKAAEVGAVRIRETVSTGARAVVNLTTGTVVYESGNSSSFGVTATSVGDGWWRIALSRTPATTLGFVIKPGDATGDGTSGIYVWGAQLEAGSFPTSYIPTAGTTATRAADIASITGTSFSSWYSQSQGTVFAEGDVTQPASGGNQFFFRSSDNSYNNSIALNVQAGGFASLSTASGGVFDGLTTTSTGLAASSKARFTGGYAANNLGASINGGTVATDSSATIPSALTRLDIGSDHAGANRIKAGHIARLTYWPTRLSNATLQSITQ